MSIGPVWRAGSVLSTMSREKDRAVNTELCQVPHPLANEDDTAARCAHGIGHRDLKHRDSTGNEWSDPGQVSGDRPWRIRDEALRELLSYCQTEAGTLDLDNLSDEFNPYDDVACRLANILDGEK